MPKPIYVLGLSAYHHDSAACLLRDGEVVAAAQEERFSRRRHDPSFPSQAARACLEIAGIPVERVDLAGFYDKPILKFDRILETHLSRAPRGIRAFIQAMPHWLKGKVRMRETVRRALGYSGPVLFAEHHLSHAASAFYPSPFPEAAILTVDGVGEWATTTIGTGRGREIEILAEQRFPHSLGLLYSAFTSYIGFKVDSGEYKVMGLAPYGEPRYAETILRQLVDLKEDGSFRMNPRYFDYAGGLRMTTRRFHRLFGGPPREAESIPGRREMDLARSIQAVTEEILLRLARSAHERTGLPYLCLAGGVALNCVANGRILREGPFRDIWVQPAAGDAGGALGVAQAIWHLYLGRPREARAGDAMKGALLGPSYSDRDIARYLERMGAEGTRMDERELLPEVAGRLAAGSVVGWFQGAMEFGPRALGARSILADPRDPRMQSRLNQKVKLRESFRPFAPAVLLDRSSDYFELDRPSPYMCLTARVRKDRAEIPAVTHVDHTARVQTVEEALHPRFFKLLREFEGETGCGVLVNTSFNVRGEPIVSTPEDAYRCFLRTGMDYLVLGSYLLPKVKQKRPLEAVERRRELALD